MTCLQTAPSQRFLPRMLTDGFRTGKPAAPTRDPRMRDGKVARVRVYLDEHEAAEAARTGIG